jgi:glycosyltransferase involved in cell wall biosynthesis
MRVLMITLRADYGGGPEHLYQLVHSLKEENLYIASPIDIPYWERYRDLVSEENLIAVPHRKFTLKNFIALIKFVRERKIEIIHSHGKGAGIYSRFISIFTGIPCVHSFHGVHVGDYNRVQKFIYIRFERFLSSITSKVIATSKSESDLFEAYKICKKSKIELILNGVAIPDKKISNSNDGNNVLKIVTVSRLNYQKNTELLIPIALFLRKSCYLDRFEFLVLGSGEMMQEFKDRLKHNNLEASFNLKGFVDDPTSFYQDAFAYISTSRWEGMPMALIHSLVNGLPIIASAVDGNRDVVLHERTGFLYELEKPEKASEWLIQLADSTELWNQLSNESFMFAQKSFSEKGMGISTKNLYRKTLNIESTILPTCV